MAKKSTKLPEETPITPEALASATKEFAGSVYGKVFIAMMQSQLDGYESVAHTFIIPAERKLAANERAAAIKGLLDFIDTNCTYADHPELLKDPTQDDPIDY